MSKPYNEQLIDQLVKTYEEDHGHEPFSKMELAAWAIQKGLWETPMKTQIQLLSDELGNAMGTARKNVDGRKVRQYHCIQQDLEDGSKQTLWCHVDLATPEFLEQSVSRRRRSQRNQNIQLHNDVVYINETKGTHIQLLFDYTDDIADYEHALANGENNKDREDMFDPEDH
jgi:hypothetical protein